MRHYCTVCGKIHNGRCSRREAAQRSIRIRNRNAAADKFRSTQAWKRKAAAILERDFHCCRVCLAAGILTNRDLSVHHIIPLNADFDKRLDDDNLITLCRFHHEQAERGAISKRELLNLASSPPYHLKIFSEVK